MSALRSLFFVVTLSFFAAVPAFGQDGLYADFNTSLGNFSCKLFYEKAPRTVANFVGLATGEKAWVDPRTGEVARRPFYNGIIFHRVIAGFVIQGGSPAGNGSDGPGYAFRDEFDPTLRHNKAGLLSMANSGPNTNGSQFFVTLRDTTHLNDVHSIFGEVVTGMEVVNAIGSVPTNGAGLPNTPVVMNSVTIRRVGAAAEAFNAAAEPLPMVGGTVPSLRRSGTSFFLQAPWETRSEYSLFVSGNLTTWESYPLEFYRNTPPAREFNVTTTVQSRPQCFFRVSQVVYPDPLYGPASFAGSQVTLNATGGTKYVLTFNASGGGTVTRTISNGTSTTVTESTITQYVWENGPYKGELGVASSALPQMGVTLLFSNAAQGTFRPNRYANAAMMISGTFTYTAQAPALLIAQTSNAAASAAQITTKSSTLRSPVKAKRGRKTFSNKR